MVIGFVYLLIIVAIVIIIFPSPENTIHSAEFYNNLSPEVRKKIISVKRFKPNKNLEDNIIKIKFPNGHIFSLSNKLSENEKNKIGNAYWTVVQEQCNENRLQMIFHAFLFWILPMMGLYILGWSAGWVYKGFKHI